MNNGFERFRKIFIVDPSHDVSLASKYTSNLVFITNGDENLEDLPEVVSKNLEDFNPSVDALIPMGKVSTCLLVGLTLTAKVGPNIPIVVGIFRKDSYTFVEWSFDNAAKKI